MKVAGAVHRSRHKCKVYRNSVHADTQVSTGDPDQGVKECRERRRKINNTYRDIIDC